MNADRDQFNDTLMGEVEYINTLDYENEDDDLYDTDQVTQDELDGVDYDPDLV